MGKLKLRGERYLGLADESVRAGFGGSKPLDAFIDQQLRSDILWLARRGSQVSFTPICSDSEGESLVGTRPYTSVAWSTVLCVPWIVQTGLKRIDLAAYAAKGGYGPSAPDMVHRARLLGLAEGSQQPLVGVLSQHDLDVQLAVPAPRRLTTSLVWEVKSAVGSLVAQIVGDGAAVNLNRLDAGSSNATFYSDPRTGAHPAATDLGLQCTLDESTDTVPAQAFDHLYTRNGTGWSGPWNSRKMTVRSTGVLRPPGRLQRNYLAYMQTRGCELRETYEGEQFVRPKESYLARQAVEARDEMAHLLALRAIHTRARCRWVGPVGEPIQTEYDRALWPTGYHRRHPRAQHDGGENPNVLFWAPVQICVSNPRITVLLNLLATQFADVVVADRDELDAKCGSARWVLDVSVRQYQDGNPLPVELASAISEEIELLHYPTDSSGRWTALLQERVRAVEDGIDGYTYKEGQLYEEDLSLLQRLELTLDVPYDVATDTRPVLVRVGVRYVKGSQVRQIEPPDLVTIDEASDIALVCVGATIWEEGTL